MARHPAFSAAMRSRRMVRTVSSPEKSASWNGPSASRAPCVSRCRCLRQRPALPVAARTPPARPRPDAVHDEAVDLLRHHDRRPAHALRPRHGSQRRLVGGLGPRTTSQRSITSAGWKKCMSQHSSGPRGRIGETRHHDVARVGRRSPRAPEGEHPAREDLALDQRKFHDGFDRPCGPGSRRGEVGRRRHAARGGLGVLTFQLALLDSPVEQLPVRCHGPLEMLGVHVDERDVDPVERRLLAIWAPMVPAPTTSSRPRAPASRRDAGMGVRSRPAT